MATLRNQRRSVAKKGKRQIKIPTPRSYTTVAWPDNSRYNWANLPRIRAEKGVGRPPAVTLKRRAEGRATI
jgi:hypothetical protein